MPVVGGASPNTTILNAVNQQASLVATALTLAATATIGPIDVSLFHSLIIDWVVGTITGTNIILAINSVDEMGVVRAIDTATVAAANGPAGLTWVLGIGASAPGTPGTRRFPDPFRRKITLVLTQTALSAITGTLSMTGS